MPWTLKQADGSHQVIGVSNGNRQNQPDGTYWVTGWPAPARAAVQVNNSYLLQAPAAPNFTSVEVKEIGGAGMGGIRFENNT